MNSLSNPATSSFALDNLLPNQPYYVRVRAQFISGSHPGITLESSTAYSHSLTGSTKPVLPTGEYVIHPILQQSATSANITWEQPTNTSPTSTSPGALYNGYYLYKACGYPGDRTAITNIATLTPLPAIPDPYPHGTTILTYPDINMIQIKNAAIPSELSIATMTQAIHWPHSARD